MSNFPNSANVVIIGAGITGVSLAHYLSDLGWKDIIVIDQGLLPRPGGSSSHAPGGMFQTNPSKMMTEAAHHGVHFYKSLNFDGQAGAVLSGGLELAETDERLGELHRRCGFGRSFGLDGHVITAKECGDILPHLDTSKVKGGYWVPDDGVGRALICTQAIQKMAEDKGVKFFGDTEVLEINKKEEPSGAMRINQIVTNQGTIKTEKIVCCAGFWGPKIGKMVGQPIPLMPMAHLYAISESIPEFAGTTEEIVMPITRSQDNDLYFRQHHDKWSVGYYGHEARPLWAEDILSPEEAPIMPSLIDWSAEDFEAGWLAGANLFPSIGKEQNLSYKINGVFSFTPDGASLMGESLSIKGFWVAEAFWYTHAAGLAKIVAEWMDAGEPQADCHEADINRFYPHVHSSTYTKARGIRTYVEVYDILHPKDPSFACRNVRQSPVQQRHIDLGGYMLEAAGFERPQWYESNKKYADKLTIEPPVRDAWSNKHYSPIEAVEAWLSRNDVALYDLSAFAMISVVGKDSLSYLQRMSTNNVDIAYGRMVYTNLLDDRGGIICDLTILRKSKFEFLIATGGGAGPHDFAWLKQNLADDENVYISDVSSQFSIFGLWGPKSRDVLQNLCSADISSENFKFFSFQEMFVEEIPVIVARLSYIGERGFEIYTDPEYALALWDKLTNAGAVPCGQGAFDSLRIEKGMRGWGSDLDPDHTPLQSGLDFIVKFDKEFKGKKALLQQQQTGLGTKIVSLVIESGQVLMGTEPVFADSEGKQAIGYVTSANYGYTVNKSIALAYIDESFSKIDTILWVDYFGKKHKAVVSNLCLFDKKSERVRS